MKVTVNHLLAGQTLSERFAISCFSFGRSFLPGDETSKEFIERETEHLCSLDEVVPDRISGPGRSKTFIVDWDE